MKSVRRLCILNPISTETARLIIQIPPPHKFPIKNVRSV